ncbi:hypothetical protein, partial [Burkholderia ambifaria]|uniref:hypothetical protein n=1 Tax=Burkholderia ambifaria TaxID=152480 RepID=UPI000B01089E
DEVDGHDAGSVGSAYKSKGTFYEGVDGLVIPGWLGGDLSKLQDWVDNNRSTAKIHVWLKGTGYGRRVELICADTTHCLAYSADVNGGLLGFWSLVFTDPSKQSGWVSIAFPEGVEFVKDLNKLGDYIKWRQDTIAMGPGSHGLPYVVVGSDVKSARGLDIFRDILSSEDVRRQLIEWNGGSVQFTVDHKAEAAGELLTRWLVNLAAKGLPAEQGRALEGRFPERPEGAAPVSWEELLSARASVQLRLVDQVTLASRWGDAAKVYQLADGRLADKDGRVLAADTRVVLKGEG